MPPRHDLAALAFKMARRALPRGWYGTRAAPADWPALQAAGARISGAPLPVFDGACDRTIWGSPAANIAFRAWHDAVHLALGADFSREGEVRVAQEQVAQARAAGASPGVLDALWADTFGQVEYFARHGMFPADQITFVRACLAGGIPAAVTMKAGG